MAGTSAFRRYPGPAGGWGSVRSLARHGLRRRTRTLAAMAQLRRQNKPGGFACVSCSWAKPAAPHPFEFCENGAKATFWDLDAGRVDAAFFRRHTVSELRTWADFDLEASGRITEPLRYDAASDRYVPTSWEDAFAAIGRELRALDPKSVVFYASGRASLEASYMYALLARLYGCNNLPDSSNMCHESTSVGLPRSLGVPVGTVLLEDFEKTDCILSFGQNVGVNSPRLLHPLQDASRRGVPILTFNPLRERGWERFKNPQSPLQMLGGAATRISSGYFQPRAGGDPAVLLGLCKALLELDDAARRGGGARVVDSAFVEAHTEGYDAFVGVLRGLDWDAIARESGLAVEVLRAAAAVYARAESAILIYGMGLTQHRHGVDNVRLLCNLALMRGNVGRPGAGVCPVRGHSNVQGQRTVGITEKPELVPLDRLAEQYGFEPPRDKGLDTVGTVRGAIEGRVRAFVGLGGNFLRAAPETGRLEAAWSRLRLTVQVATKLNRSHLVNGEVAFLLPCLSRIERDRQAGGVQAVSVEDSTACIHRSLGVQAPASDRLLSEPAIVAGIAEAALPPNPKVPWRDWVADYARVRDAIARTYPADFHDFNARLGAEGGFPRPNGARERIWHTPSGKAQFHAAGLLSATGFADAPQRLRLVTVRSNDQFNTTVYGYSDRFRGIEGTRRVLLMHRDDIARLGLAEGEQVSLVGDADDGVHREVGGLRVTAYDVPAGCVVGYYPECNPLIPVEHHAIDSHVPAAKSVPVRIEREVDPRRVPAGPAP
ncbi:FdhF/YdeP family oxidoreductase [Luteimonas huabeiensis]|uniref:FdhF/YdeP family oxidoreductase n=1 Tax=Luteimonas huabeiensis TaxID=1244513 RepID=UPI0004657E5C|nr:FdhF/YdeP family oxidoreductase [Luteimonas huabeiensis]